MFELRRITAGYGATTVTFTPSTVITPETSGGMAPLPPARTPPRPGSSQGAESPWSRASPVEAGPFLLAGAALARGL